MKTSSFSLPLHQSPSGSGCPSTLLMSGSCGLRARCTTRLTRSCVCEATSCGCFHSMLYHTLPLPTCAHATEVRLQRAVGQAARIVIPLTVYRHMEHYFECVGNSLWTE